MLFRNLIFAICSPLCNMILCFNIQTYFLTGNVKFTIPCVPRLGRYDIGGVISDLIRDPPNSFYRKGDLFQRKQDVLEVMMAGTHTLVEHPYIARFMLASYNKVNTIICLC